MNVEGAVHGFWCNSHTYPTRCKYCGEEVFYFSCSCGCRVFFDHLGAPWPVHSCIEYKVATFGEEAVAEALEQRMMQPGYSRRPLRIEREYAEKVRRQSEADRKTPRETMAMEPPPHAHIDGVGHVRAIVNNVNVFRKLHLPEESPISCALLGDLGTGHVSQVTIVVDDLSPDDMESYTAVAPTAMLARAGIRPGALVEFRLSVLEVPSVARLWRVEEIEVLRCLD